MARRIRVLVVDDHRIFAESLAAALAAEPDVDTGAAGSAPAALRCLQRAAAEGRAFDVVLVDAGLGRHSGAQAQAQAQVQAQTQAQAQSQSGLTRAAAVHAASATSPPSAPSPTSVPSGGLAPPRVSAMTGPHAASSGGVPVPRLAEAGAQGPPGGGLSLVAALQRSGHGARAVVIAEKDEPRCAALALQAGACGWVAKDSSLQRLHAVIRGVLRDETHLPPALLTGVLREMTSTRKHRSESERLIDQLTPREREVLRCMVAGLGRKAVAERLYLSPHTVRTHMQNVLGKLQVHSTLAAVALARRAGVGPVDLEEAS
ncbi:response regulator transcription factor [Streptomyces sp. NA04227]|uniref:response regulator transcription factor n=1 Tax=Streptomyces sp. NA04227 TaxID=2742136 RepID=UPI0020CA3E8C|nr:response regulator transcription factor [Streptomyces sp. NA04227]